MKKKILITGISALVISLLSIFAFVPINGVYESKLSNWMSEVSDNQEIRKMSIPGTHDSGATHSIVDIAGKCQDLSIKEQLNIGVRLFDIRLQMVNNTFKIVHDFVDQKLSLKSVVEDFSSFIRTHKDEFLLISIKQDYSSVNSTLGFEELLKQYLNPYQDVFTYSNEIPTYLKDARGKIYIIDRYGMSIGVSASSWSDNTTFENDNFYVQDYYCINNVEEKINCIDSTLNYSKNNHTKLTLNFASCYIDGGFPPLYAGTPAKTINLYLENKLKDISSTGVILLDYVSSKLTSIIIGGNK